MKKSLLVLGVGMLALYSCNSSGSNAAAEQAKADSIANAQKVQDAAAAQAKQDSITNAANAQTMQAQAQADSLKGAMAQQQKDAKTTKTVIVHEGEHHHAGARETQPAPMPTTGNGKPSMRDNTPQQNANNPNSNTTGNGKPSMK